MSVQCCSRIETKLLFLVCVENGGVLPERLPGLQIKGYSCKSTLKRLLLTVSAPPS